MQTITAPPQFVRSLLEGAKLRGYDAGEILIAEGLPAQAQENQRVRISTKQFAALTTRVIQMLDDEACDQLERRTPSRRAQFVWGIGVVPAPVFNNIGLWAFTSINCLTCEHLLDKSDPTGHQSCEKDGRMSLSINLKLSHTLEWRITQVPVRQGRKSSPAFKCTNKGTGVRIAQHKSNAFNTIPFLIDQINGHIPAGFLFQYLIGDALLLQAAFETLRV